MLNGSEFTELFVSFSLEQHTQSLIFFKMSVCFLAQEMTWSLLGIFSQKNLLLLSRPQNILLFLKNFCSHTAARK